MKVIYTAIFGPYDDLNEPTVITPGWRYICYTDQPLTSATWEIVHTPVPDGVTAQRYARWFKIMHWIDWEHSMWIDASFTISCDLNAWWENRFKFPFAAAKHPLRNDIYHECRSCIVNSRGDEGRVELQNRRYISLGVPSNTGIITSGILMRENTQPCIQLHERWWSELAAWSVRDQLSFAFVSLGIDWINVYNWDYTKNSDFIYKKHRHLRQ